MHLKQEVSLEVFDKESGGTQLLKTSGLRVDFDVRMIPDFNRAKFTIYNLNNTVVTSLSTGKKWATLKVVLNDGKEYTVAERYFISNVMDELKLPDRVITLYCLDNLKVGVLEKPTNVIVKQPSLEKSIFRILDDAGHIGPVNFVDFPAGLEKEFTARPQRPYKGSVQSCIKELELEYNFSTYTYNGGMYFMYKLDLDEVLDSDLYRNKASIVFRTEAMRSNPKIGLASALISSILDPRIYPSRAFDLSELITISNTAGEETLKLSEGFLKNFSAFSKYQAFAVQHKGSNYTKDWDTRVTGLSPTKGKFSSTVAWANIGAN